MLSFTLDLLDCQHQQVAEFLADGLQDHSDEDLCHLFLPTNSLSLSGRKRTLTEKQILFPGGPAILLMGLRNCAPYVVPNGNSCSKKPNAVNVNGVGLAGQSKLENQSHANHGASRSIIFVHR